MLISVTFFVPIDIICSHGIHELYLSFKPYFPVIHLGVLKFVSSLSPEEMS